MGLTKHARALKRAGLLGGLIFAAGGIATGFRWVIPQVNHLYSLTLPDSPYFILSHAALLYLAMPAVVLCGLIFILAPGILVILAWGKTTDWTVVALKGFATTYLVYFVMTGAYRLVFRQEKHVLIKDSS